ncbi:MFS transporter [Aerococcus mictus]|nr:MFS transporter [Aerococcus mictus]RAV93880.1 MFS transporter [Aerococcus mictus]
MRNSMKENKLFYGWWVVLGAIIMLAVMGPASVAVANLFQPYVVEEFGIANSAFAIVNSIVLGMGIFVSPFVSQQFAKKGNFKRFYLIGVLAYAISYGLYAFAPNIYVFYLLSIGVGFGYTATTIIPVSMLVNNWFVKSRGTALSLSFAGLGLGGIIFSQLLTWLIGDMGWRMAYLVYAIIMLVVGIPIVMMLFVEHPEAKGLHALGAAEVDDTADHQEEDHTGVKLPTKDAFKKPFFIMLLIGTVFIGISNNGGLGQFPPYVQQLHGASKMAQMVSIYSGVGILGKLVLGVVNDKFGVRIATLYASLLCALAYFLMLFSGNYTFVFLMAIFFGLGNAIGTVLPPLMTSSIFNADDYPKAYGIVQSALMLGMTSGSLLAATLADVSGTYQTAWVFLAVLSALIAVFWIAAHKQAEKYM